VDKVVAVTLTNDKAMLAADDETMELLDDFWSYSAPGAFHSVLFKTKQWDGKKRFMQKDAVPSGLFRATRWDIVEKLGIKFVVTKQRQKLSFLPGIPRQEAAERQYQNECVDAMCNAVGKGGGIVLAATRTGKTAICSSFFSRIKDNCLFIVDQIELLDQSQEEIKSWIGEEVGIVGRSVFAPARVTVGTIQTLKLHEKDKKFLAWFKTVQIVVVDELHEMMASKNFKILKTIQPIARFGLTATLQLRKKDVRMRAWAFAGPVIFEYSIADGVKNGVLTKGHVLQLQFPYLALDSQDHREIYEYQVLGNQDKLDTWMLLSNRLVQQDRYVITLTDRVAHVKALADACPHDYELAFGEIGRQARKTAKTRFDSGKVQHIIANRVFKKGVTIKRVDAMFDLAELPSKNDCIQKFGRGIGWLDGKQELVYIDFATQGNNGLASAAKKRISAFRAAGIPVTQVKVSGPAEAAKAMEKFITSICKTPTQPQL
jgi:superfamily II DNA or RNA helicase